MQSVVRSLGGRVARGMRPLSRKAGCTAAHDDSPYAADPRLLHTHEPNSEFLVDPEPPRDPLTEFYAKHRTLVPHGGNFPSVPLNSHVSPSATLIGDVLMRDAASVWAGSTLRGDSNNIYLGAFTNVQENCTVLSSATVATGLDARTTLGNWVTVGPGCVLGACTIHSTAVLGGRVVIGEGAIVEPGAVVAAGSVIPAGGLVPSGQVWGGVGEGLSHVRTLGGNERLELKRIAVALWEVAQEHKEQYLPYNTAAWEKARVDEMEAGEREEFVGAMKRRIEEQGDELREKLGARREELRRSGALGEASA